MDPKGKRKAESPLEEDDPGRRLCRKNSGAYNHLLMRIVASSNEPESAPKVADSAEREEKQGAGENGCGFDSILLITSIFHLLSSGFHSIPFDWRLTTTKST